jgi:hypothetical protein
MRAQLWTVVVVAAALGRGANARKPPGNAVDPSTLRCVNFTETAGADAICGKYITWPVVHFVGQDLKTLDITLRDNVATLSSMTTPACASQNIRLGCWMQFPKCSEREVGGATFAVPEYPCNDVCTYTLQNCTDVYDAISMIGNMMDYLPMCGDGLGGHGGAAEQRYGQPPDLFGVQVSPAIIDL